MKSKKRFASSLVFSSLLLVAGVNVADLAVEASWLTFPTTDGSALTARHEAAGAVHGENIYLLGGRGNRPVERFSVANGQWENLGLAPFEMHHMQPVVLNDTIYVLGALTCCYPREEIVSDIYTFDTQAGTWDVVGSMPSDRVRGSVAAVVHEDKIYLLGGNTAGHDGGAVSWFDEYDPETMQWRVLPDAPNARDHFSAVMIGNQLVAAAGRQTALPSPAANPVMATDIFDFATGEWRSGSPIPTGRAGVVSVAYDGHVIVAGGEINTSADALDVVEAYDIESDTWQSLPSMTSGRHGSGGGVVGSHLYILSGAPTIGGASELPGSESLELPDVVDRDTVDPEVVVTEVIEHEVPQTEVEEHEVITPEVVPTETSSRKSGGSSGLLLLIGLLCARWVRQPTA